MEQTCSTLLAMAQSAKFDAEDGARDGIDVPKCRLPNQLEIGEADNANVLN